MLESHTYSISTDIHRDQSRTDLLVVESSFKKNLILEILDMQPSSYSLHSSLLKTNHHYLLTCRKGDAQSLGVEENRGRRGDVEKREKEICFIKILFFRNSRDILFI